MPLLHKSKISLKRQQNEVTILITCLLLAHDRSKQVQKIWEISKLDFFTKMKKENFDANFQTRFSRNYEF